MSGRQKSVNVTGLLREDHVVLGDDEVDYSKKYWNVCANRQIKKQETMHNIRHAHNA